MLAFCPIQRQLISISHRLCHHLFTSCARLMSHADNIESFDLRNKENGLTPAASGPQWKKRLCGFTSLDILSPLWTKGAATLAGLAAFLAGGCPTR